MANKDLRHFLQSSGDIISVIIDFWGSLELETLVVPSPRKKGCANFGPNISNLSELYAEISFSTT